MRIYFCVGGNFFSQEAILTWLLAETYEAEDLRTSPKWSGNESTVIEVGPRLNFQTAWSSNAVSICHACGLTKVSRLERSRRYIVQDLSLADLATKSSLTNLIHDRMTEQVYESTLRSFDSGRLL